MKYRQRAVDPALEGALETHPVVLLEGARQTGKTTSVMRICEKLCGKYLTLDEPATRKSLTEDPMRVLGAN